MRVSVTVNLALDCVAATVAVFGWFAFTQQVDAKFPLVFASPYARTAALWASAYLGVDLALVFARRRRFMWPLKPVFFVMLWGWHELVWNSVYFIDRWPLELTVWGYVGTFQWYRYVWVVGSVSITAAAAVLAKGKVRLSARWLLALLAFEAAYAAAGVPIEGDLLKNVLLPQNAGWELGYNLVVLPLYLLIFRERRPRVARGSTDPP